MVRRLVVLLVVVSCVLACSKGKPSKRRFRLDFGHDSGLVDGVKLYLGDELLGRVDRPRPLGADTKGKSPTVSFSLPVAEVLHEKASELEVRLDTPCGPKTLGVKVPDLEDEENKARKKDRYAVNVDAELDGEVPAFAQFWVDRRSGKRKVSVGKATIEPPQVGARLFDLGCADEHEVAVDGTSYGKVSAAGLIAVEGMDEGMTKTLETERRFADKRRDLLAKRRSYPLPSAHIFIGEPDTCYRDGFVVYKKVGDMSGGGSSRILKGRALHQLRSEPRYFMKEAPGSAQSMTNTTELVAVDCKSKKVLR